jgi:hypothetical protein
MSFSFNAKGKTKGEAKSKAMYQFAGMVQDQRPHDADRAVVQQAVEGAVNALGEPTVDETVVVECHGSVSGMWDGLKIAKVTSTTFSVHAYLQSET